MTDFGKFDNNKKKLLEGLKLYRGIISSACEFANLDRQTFYNYKADDEDFAKEVASIDEASIDFVIAIGVLDKRNWNRVLVAS